MSLPLGPFGHARSRARGRSALSWVGVALLAMAAPSAPLRAADAGASAPAVRPALSVQLVRASQQPLARRTAANGSLAAWQEAIVSAELPGLRLTELRAQVGDTVRKGQVLALFNADTIQADLAAARAGLAEASAALADAAANAQRARDLQHSGALSAQQIQQLLTAEQTARARVQAQQALVDSQEIRLRHTQLTAPDAGVISARAATLGAVVGAGQELFRLIRQGRLEWRAEVAAAELPRLAPGQAAELVLPDGTRVNGRVRLVAPTVDPATRNGLVYVDLPQPGPARAGMFARGEIEGPASQAWTLPAGAVTLREGFERVFSVGSDHKVRQHKVLTGRRQGGRVEVVSGLPAGAAFVADGGAFLADGDTVRVVGAAGPAASAAPR